MNHPSIDQARYILLGTQKRDGTIVDTPVWLAGADGHYVIFSAADAGKVKRLRNFSQCRIAPCTMNGKALGDSIQAEAQFIDDATEITDAHQQLLKKYRWQMRMLDWGSKLSGKYHHRQFVRLSL